MHDDMRLLRIGARGAGPGLAGDGLEERVADRFSEQPRVAGAGRRELAGTGGRLHLQRGSTRWLDASAADRGVSPEAVGRMPILEGDVAEVAIRRMARPGRASTDRNSR